jgi:2,3-bisphosphoglycerate-dependent phosphoglycerate mutase
MRIFVWVDIKRCEIGSPALLHAFFSTVAYRLERDDWGGRFPKIMRGFYKGRLSPGDADAAIAELAVIRDELERLPVDELVWDFDDLDRQPPWEAGIRETLANAAECFVTPNGDSLLDVLNDAFVLSRTDGSDARIVRQK